jgi:hypothetical protein
MGESAGVPSPQSSIPLCPDHAMVKILCRHEQSVVIQPRGILGAEYFESAGVNLTCIAEEVQRRFTEQSIFEGDYFAVIHDIGWKLRRSREILRFQETPLLELQQIDEQWVAGKGRKALIRRVAIAGWTEGQDLPYLLSRLSQEVDEFVGARPEVANTVSRRQRSNGKQDSTTARKNHTYKLVPGSVRYKAGRFFPCANRSALDRFRLPGACSSFLIIYIEKTGHRFELIALQ